jgi:RNA polymerase sigma-70 factor (ECF subfamily)
MGGFEELYREHYRKVNSICRRMMGNVTDAEDLTQDVFLQVYLKLGSFRGESAFTTWLHRLTVNRVLMHFRKRSVKCEDVSADDRLRYLIERAEIYTEATPLISRMILEDALAKLPRGQREVIMLHDVEGYEHQEIAAKLDCHEGTSKSQLHKARRKLRLLLEGNL